MKRLVALLILSCGILSCGQSSGPNGFQYRVVREELHLGEYLAQSDDNKLISVSRNKGPMQGIVSVDVDTDEVTVLHPEFPEARDIFFEEGWTLWRNENSIYISDQNSDPKKLMGSTERLRGLSNRVIALNHRPLGSLFVCLNANGEIDQIVEYNYRVIQFKDSWGVFHNEKELGALRFTSCDKEPEYWSIQQKVKTEYASIKVESQKISVAYLDETDGVLKWASGDLKNAEQRQLQIEIVDGNPHQNHLGMDIARFPYKSRDGLLYLDAWKLQIRVAIYEDGKWMVKPLPIKGAVGFYSQYLGREEGKLQFATHNFRTLRPDFSQSFEDLMLLEIDLSQLFGLRLEP